MGEGHLGSEVAHSSSAHILLVGMGHMTTPSHKSRWEM